MWGDSFILSSVTPLSMVFGISKGQRGSLQILWYPEVHWIHSILWEVFQRITEVVVLVNWRQET